MAEVITMPGVERPSLWSLHILPTEAIIVGRMRNGSLYVAAANGDAEKATGMLMRAVHMLASEDWTPDAFETE